MRVLIVTGRLAEDSVKKKISDHGMEAEVLTLPVSVAAFITPEYAAQRLQEYSTGKYDYILLPGTVRGDVSPVEDATGILTFKGPSTVNDLPLVLSLLGEVQLSKTTSASELIRDIQAERALAEIEEVEGNWRQHFGEGCMIIGRGGRELPIGPDFPMRVIAEIVNAPTLEPEAVKKRARYYGSEGADIIDIGMLAGIPSSERVQDLVETVRGVVDLPISIDTLNPDEIKEAVDAGVDLVLSVDRGNMDEVAGHLADVPVVVLPSNMREGVLAKGAVERVEALRENIATARALGLTKVIADPVLEPALKPGLLESLLAYKLFRERDPETPVLFGQGNVTELIDVDSTGVNGLLAALGAEVGANLLFIPEYSTKAFGSVRDTATASRMMFLAKRREAPPKDLGVDLLVFKEKRRREEPYDPSLEAEAKVLDGVGEGEFRPDEAGWFKIQVDRDEGLIAAIHYPQGAAEPDMVVKGSDCRSVYQTIIRHGLIGKLDHAAYLGKELEKAELALRLGRSYVQDEELF